MIRPLILLLFFLSSLFAQEPDTLLPRILQLQNDTEKVNQLYSVGFSLRNKDPRLAYLYAKHCETTALTCHSKKLLAKSYNLLGVLYYKKGDLKKAFNYHELAFKIRVNYHDYAGMGYSLTNLGNIYTDLASLYNDSKLNGKAENCYLEALQNYNLVGEKKQIANCLINLGVLKQNQSQYNAAYENYSSAFEIGKKLNDYEIRSICLNNLGQIFSDKGDLEKAISYNRDALKLRGLMDDELGCADSYLSLTEIYIKQKKPMEALASLNLAKKICNRNDYHEGKLMLFSLSSDINVLQNNYRLAYEELRAYQRMKDSLAVSNKEIQNQFNFDENVSSLTSKNKVKKIPNLIAGIFLFTLMILIPLTLIRNKR